MTSPTLDLAQLAHSAGIVRADNVATSKDFASALNAAVDAKGLQVLILSTEPDVEVVRPPIALDPVLTKHRFMAAIKAPRYVPTMFGGGKLEGE